MKYSIILFAFLIASSCSFFRHYNEADVKDLAKEVSKSALKVEIEKLASMNVSSKLVKNNSFSTVEKLPGKEFKEDFKRQPEIRYNDLGEILLSAGDYTIPVMTFCLVQNLNSPEGYIYNLNIIQGLFAKIIRELSLKTVNKYKTEEIQTLIWNILGGLSYFEMNVKSQLIIDETIPEYKAQLEKSHYRQIVEKWNYLSKKSYGQIPNFESATSDYLNQLGSSGAVLLEARNTYNNVLKAKGDYKVLRSSINTLKVQQKEKRTVWTKISDRVYARFVTKGSFNEVGALQIRITSTQRQPSTEQKDTVTFDIASLVAESSNSDAQPLALFPLYGLGGIAIESAAVNPYAAATVMKY